MGTRKFDFFSSKKFKIEFDLYFDLCWRAEIIQVGLNMHLYVDIGDASSSLWGSTSSYFINYYASLSQRHFMMLLFPPHVPAGDVERRRFGRGRGELRKMRERRDREEEACHLQWSLPHVAHWEVGGSGRTVEEVRDRVTGVRIFRALWSRLSSYAVPLVSHGWGETRAELGEGRAVCPGEALLRGRDRRRADSQQPVWGKGLAVGVGLRNAIDEVGGDRRSEAGLQSVPDVARAWVCSDGWVGGMVRSEGTE